MESLAGVILGLSLIVYPHLNISNLSNFGGKIFKVAGVIILLVSIFFIDIERPKVAQSETVPNLNSLSNGIYASLGLYPYPNQEGRWLAILHPTTIVGIDSTNRVVMTVNIGNCPLLVKIDYPISSPKMEGVTNQFVRLVEVGTNKAGKFIHDYKPSFSLQR